MRNWLRTSAIVLAVGALALLWLSQARPLGRESDVDRTAVASRSHATDRQTTRSEPDRRHAPRPAPSSHEQARTRTPSLEASPRAEAPASADASPDPIDVATRLESAIREAERERGLYVAPTVVDHVLHHGDVRILFPVASDAEVAIVKRLVGGAAPDPRAPALRVFPLVGQAAAHVDAITLLSLIASGATDHIGLDEIHRPSLDTTIPLIRADVAHAAGDDGTGRVIAVLDTGVDLDHPMFTGRIVEEACFSILGQCPNASTTMTGPGAGEACPWPGCGHGTSVAGIAVGRQPDDSLIGVAPAADLIAIRIFSDTGGDIGAYTSDVIAGLQHVLALTASYSIDVANLSFGGNTYQTASDCDTAGASTGSVVAQLQSAGVVTVAAGGNDGLADAITSPACLSNVVGVGATDDADVVPGYSNSDDLLSLLAPGVSVETAGDGGATHFAGGTSMAAPHASGAVALIRTRHPMATPAEIENAVILSGVPVYDARGDVTVPRVDVQAAIDLLTAAASPPSPSPSTPGGGGGGASAPSAASSGGGGGACGLIGIEPFLVLVGVRLRRQLRA